MIEKTFVVVIVVVNPLWRGRIISQRGGEIWYSSI